jgi:hypothetical protein
VAAPDDRRLREGQRLARGDAQLPVDEVDAGDHLGDRMLHLEPRVHLHEVVLTGTVRWHDELHGARAHVAARPRGGQRALCHRLARRLVEEGRRAFFHDLLVAALKTALAFAEVDDVAVRVGEHLDLDVAGAAHPALHEERVVAERARGLAPGGGDRTWQLRALRHQSHALAPAAGSRLEEDGQAHRLGCGRDLGVRHAGRAPTRHHRHPCRSHEVPRPDLVAHRLDHIGGRPDPHELRTEHGPCELRPLREEPVARVHRLRTGRRGRSDDGVGVEVPGDRDGHVGAAHVQTSRVVGGVHGDRSHPLGAKRPEDPDGDLAAVGDEHRREGPSGQRRHGIRAILRYIRNTP